MKTRRRTLAIAPLLACLTLMTVGCENTAELDLRRQVGALSDQVAEKDRLISSQQSTIKKLNRQLQQTRGLTDDDLTKIFYPEKIVIDDLSGGDDYDGEPGDDGVTVYLQPIDRDGDAVKVAGDIRIELYDLQNPSGQKLIGDYVYPVDKVSRLWYGKLSTYHYTLRCPWKSGPPAHAEVTIRATFVDFLTQRVISTQEVCTIDLPG